MNSFNTLVNVPEPKTKEDGEKLADMLEDHLIRLSNTVLLVAMGIQEMGQKKQSFDFSQCPILSDFLDKFHISRIGTRVVTGHFVALHRRVPAGFVGLIDETCRPSDIVWRAYRNARWLCALEYGRTPGMVIHDPSDVTIRYIPEHIHHICFEVLKNSMRAVCENCDKGIDEDDLPLIKVVIAAGEKEVTIKIVDEGGGIKRIDMEKV